MTTLNLQVGATADDGFCVAVEEFYSSEVNLTIGNDDGAHFDTYTRFTNITIPKAALIISAHLTFTAQANYSADTVRIKLSANDADNATAPTDCATLAAKARTSAQTDWDFTTDWTTDDEYDSPDFKASIQKVIDRSGWSYGNALMIHIDDDGSSTDARRDPHDYSSDSAKATKLTIVYSLAAPKMNTYRRLRT